MIQARRLGFAVLTSPDISRQVAYWTETLGLQVSHETGDRVVLASCQGVETVVLVPGASAGLSGLSFQLAPAELDAATRSLAALGVSAERRPGPTLGTADALVFQDPNGTEIILFDRLEFMPAAVGQQGIAALKLGHVAHLVPEVEAVTAFYERTLGFRRSDWRTDRAMFMRCGPDHHTMNFFKGPLCLQHLALEVANAAELSRAADLLTRGGYNLDWGPGRHNIGHNIACYHRNGDGIRIELYCEMDQMLDEALGFYEPRPWHRDRPQRPRNWENTPRNAWIPDAP